jgi:SAM-dependent methyltransferase
MPPNGVRSHPIYAALYDRLNAYAERTWLGEARRRIAELARGTLLEIGAGTGANFSYYHHQEIDEVIACEPDPAYRRQLTRQLTRRVPETAVAVRIVAAAAEQLPIADHSVDTVVSTLTMCSVDEPARVAAELARILRPDGRVLLFEHIRTDRGPLPRLLQTTAVPVWRCFAGGCRLNRPTLDTLRTAGFEVKVLDSLDAPHTPRVMYPFVTAIASPAPIHATSELA